MKVHVRKLTLAEAKVESATALAKHRALMASWEIVRAAEREVATWPDWKCRQFEALSQPTD